jgi:hypothetical protein
MLLVLIQLIWKFLPHKKHHMNVNSSFFHNCPKLKQPKYPSRWMNKQDMAHPCNGILFQNKKECENKKINK